MTTQSATQSNTSGKVRLDVRTVNSYEQRFADWLDTKVIGQKEGKKAARAMFRRTQSKIKALRRQPKAAFIFLGPSTSGKTETFLRLVEYVHGDRDCYLKIDGSEYRHDAALSKLTGGSNMWVGHVDRKSPNYVPPKANEKDTAYELSHHNVHVYALHRSKTGARTAFILVDEWEKACRDFNNVWLSILRDGRLTAGNGEEVLFDNVVIGFTGNLGSAAVEEAQKKEERGRIGFASRRGTLSREEMVKIVDDHLRDYAAPEFRKRIQELGGVVIFDALTSEQVGLVTDLKLAELRENVAQTMGITLEFDDSVRPWLLKTSANDLANVTGNLQLHIVDALDNELVKSDTPLAKGDTIEVTVEGDELVFDKVLHLVIAVTGMDDPEFLAAVAQAEQAGLGGATSGDAAAVDLAALTGDAEFRSVVAEAAKRLRLAGKTVDPVALLQQEDVQQALAACRRRAENGEHSQSGSMESSGTEGATTEGRIFQPFMVTAVLADRAAVRATRDMLEDKFDQNEVHIIRENTAKVVVPVQGQAVPAIALQIHVVATIETMTKLKSGFPAGIKVETEVAEL